MNQSVQETFQGSSTLRVIRQAFLLISVLLVGFIILLCWRVIDFDPLAGRRGLVLGRNEIPYKYPSLLFAGSLSTFLRNVIPAIFVSKLSGMFFLKSYLQKVFPIVELILYEDGNLGQWLSQWPGSTFDRQVETFYSTYRVWYRELSGDIEAALIMPPIFGRLRSFLSLAGMSYGYLQTNPQTLCYTKDYSNLLHLAKFSLRIHELLTFPLSGVLNLLFATGLGLFTPTRYSSFRPFFLLLCFISNPEQVIFRENFLPSEQII